jgi:hypothetical protein
MTEQKATDSEVDRLMRLSSTDIDLNFLKNSFAFKDDNKQNMSPNSIFQISPILLKRYPDNPINHMITESQETTVGRYIVNLFLFSWNERISKNLQYVNLPFNKNMIGQVENNMAILLKEDVITSDDYIEYIDRIHWFSFSITAFSSTSLDMSILSPLKNVNIRKMELFEKHKARIERGDITIVADIEAELISLAKETLKSQGSTGLITYNSGAAGTFENNYKATAIMRGLIPKSNDFTKFHISKSNLMDGIGKDEIDKYADIAVIASFSRAVGTQDGGYLSKIYNSAFSHISLDVDGSDCGTKYSIRVAITKDNAEAYYLRHVINKDGSFKLLTDKVLKESIGKTFDIRSPLYCTTDKICHACAGSLYHKLGFVTVGPMITKISANLLQKSLKKFHDLSVKTTKLNMFSHFRAL